MAKKQAACELILIAGFPASGKTTLTQEFTNQGYLRLNRDTVGGAVDDLLPRLSELLAAGKRVVMDNLYATCASRAGAIAVARKHEVSVRCMILDTGLEDAQFNACLRMVERCGKVLHPEEQKQKQFRDDPNLFPVAVLYRYRKEYEEPTQKEGFAAIETIKFQRNYPSAWVNRAIILDYDGTLREHTGGGKYPTHPSQVRALPGRAEKLKEYQQKGYLLLGASNQSGVAKGDLTAEGARACFEETNRQLELKIDFRFCPHKVPPISCYCRKPGPGMGVELIVKHALDPRQCIYVGDMGTDKSFAARCGFQFQEAESFFA
jgi:HAD superfamily hydrolase (TIGR01662 family)